LSTLADTNGGNFFNVAAGFVQAPTTTHISMAWRHGSDIYVRGGQLRQARAIRYLLLDRP
jgi:hypothetical protein